MRNNHRNDNEEHYNAITLELKLCKTVTYKAGDKRLNQSAGYRKEDRIDKRLDIVVIYDNCLIDLEGEMLGDQRDGRVNYVLLCHKGTRNLGDEGVNNDEGNAEHQNETHYVDARLDPDVGGLELLEHTLLEGKLALVINADSVFGFFSYYCLFIHVNYTSLISSLIEYERGCNTCHHRKHFHPEHIKKLLELPADEI
mgnify:CR=1 FL=1